MFSIFIFVPNRRYGGLLSDGATYEKSLNSLSEVVQSNDSCSILLTLSPVYELIYMYNADHTAKYVSVIGGPSF